MSQTPITMDDLLLHRQIDDPVMITTMVEQYRSIMFHFALSILHDPFEAEDAMQDAFVSAILHLNRYTPGTNFKAWLYSITLNVCRSYLRKQRTRMAYEGVLRTLHLIHTSPLDPEQSTLDNERSKQLWSLVSRLSMKHQFVIILRIKHQLPISEIASILGTNEKTVYTRLYDAFRQLRAWLKYSKDFD